MPKIVVDTNVIVSATISKQGIPAKILESWRQNEFNLIISPNISKEFRRVLFKENIRQISYWSEKKIDAFFKDLKISGINTPGKLELQVIKQDPDDDKFLIAAIEGQADYIVSGDTHLKELKEYQGIKILSPREFLRKLEQPQVDRL